MPHVCRPTLTPATHTPKKKMLHVKCMIFLREPAAARHKTVLSERREGKKKSRFVILLPGGFLVDVMCGRSPADGLTVTCLTLRLFFQNLQVLPESRFLQHGELR